MKIKVHGKAVPNSDPRVIRCADRGARKDT
jgi:hypothetical protein